ncbi:conjugal transfer protein TraD, partial [Escherichia coli]|nr:conjugal transfer protein TraD [Escherichia coli]
ATPDDLRKLAALVKAEKAAEKAQRAKASVAKIVNAEKLAERKRRDRELYQSAGLLILAGLVDTKTGTPTRDRGELLGALVSLADNNVADEKRAEWKRKGDALLAAKGSK